MVYEELEEIVKVIFKEIMPSNYSFNVTRVCGYMEIVPDSDSRIFTEEELSQLIDSFNFKLKEKTSKEHCVGGYKFSNSSDNIKLQSVTIL